MAGELIATGVSLSIGDAAPTEAFTVIPGVVGVPSFPETTAAVIDVTALDSAATEKLLGLADTSEFSFVLNLRKNSAGDAFLAAQETLRGYAGDGIARGLRILTKAGSTTLETRDCRVFVKSFTPSASSANSAITATVTMEITGAVTVS
jgi:hypothetical protein